jgi:hypothetical protein
LLYETTACVIMKFILFTKTLWTETPRIRHQLARLLVKQGHEVIFFEKNSFLGQRHSHAENGIEFRRHPELLHHQLRPLRFLAEMNAKYEQAEIRRMLGDSANAVIVNFCYDYYFLRDIFLENVIISIINDDFIAAAKWFMKSEAGRVTAATARMSDHNLVVSYPLLHQMKQFTDNVSLFLPWARRQYSRPINDKGRDEMLYWGYINYRIDLDAVKYVLDAGIKINFVGPASRAKEVRNMLAHENAHYHGVAQLDSIEQVLASCACSIIPYDSRNPRVAAITMNNRAFHLLSYGLPLLYADLPGLINAPQDVIYACKTGQDYVRAYKMARERFVECQPSIASFLEGHGEEDRYRQLMGYIENARLSKELV